MKKYSIAVCVCAVLFSVGIHGGGMREVFARAPGADENLAILQDIIRENECQAGMAFLGYTYEGADAAEILEYTRQGEVAAAYPFLQNGTVVDAGGYEIYAIVPGDDCRVSVYPAQPTEEGEYLDDLNSPYYRGQENEIIILRCNVSEIHSNVMVSVQKQNMSVQYHPMVSLKDGHLATETHCYDFSMVPVGIVCFHTYRKNRIQRRKEDGRKSTFEKGPLPGCRLISLYGNRMGSPSPERHPG